MDLKTRYQLFGVIFQSFCLAANVAALLFLFVLLAGVLSDGVAFLSADFLQNYPSRTPEKAGILSAIVGSIFMMGLTALFAIPTGIGAAIYIEEYASESRMIRFIKLNIQNLAGVPSIVYGILGLTLFVRGLELGRSLLAGSLTMALLILPVITISAQEALRAVPDSFRLAGFGIGMTRWQVVRNMVLPVAVPGMLTGIILALSRAIGETAPLIMIGALTFVAFLPASPMDGFTVLPIQIFNWTSRPQAEFHALAASGIIVLLVVLLAMNAFAIFLRIYFRNKLKHLA
ncbi:MAG: phosphate ABC transporter permease PstA [Leptospirales bacterium]|jgi:phosphate transport system permease protein